MAVRKVPKIGKVSFALVDIKSGRKAIAKLVDNHKRRIPIMLAGYIVSQWSGDDGESIEFEIDVRRVRLKKPIDQNCRCVRCEAKRVERKDTKITKLRKDRSDPEGGIPGRQL